MLVQGAIYNHWNGMVEWNTEMSNFKLVAFINNGFCLAFLSFFDNDTKRMLLNAEAIFLELSNSYTVATQMSLKQCDK